MFFAITYMITGIITTFIFLTESYDDSDIIISILLGIFWPITVLLYVYGRISQIMRK